MNTIDKIRAEIRRLYSEDSDRHIVRTSLEALSNLMDFLDTLEEPEQPTMGYDEAYLNEKIAKASKSWEGVDVDKYMDEVRGREPVSDCNDLEDEIDRVIADYSFTKTINSGGFKTTVLDYEKIARYFAEWGAEHLRDSTKKISEDLEEAAIDFADYARKQPKDYAISAIADYDHGCIDGFKAGAEWQKNHMIVTIKQSDLVGISTLKRNEHLY